MPFCSPDAVIQHIPECTHIYPLWNSNTSLLSPALVLRSHHDCAPDLSPHTVKIAVVSGSNDAHAVPRSVVLVQSTGPRVPEHDGRRERVVQWRTRRDVKMIVIRLGEELEDFVEKNT